MEETPHIVIPPPKPQQANSPRTPLGLVGLVVFALIFGAAATSTFALLNSTHPTQTHTETAAVADTKPLANTHAYDALSLEAKSVYVLDLSNNQVLYQKDAEMPRPLASITKVMTALVATEVLPINEVITIPFDTSPPGSAERLAQGDHWQLADVLTFTLVSSSNGGADIIAQAANPLLHQKYPQVADDGVNSVTLWRMNDLAKSLGLTSMHFYNDNGLDENTSKAGAYGSAKDVALLFGYAVQNKQSIFAGTAKQGLSLESVDGTKTVAFNTDHAISAIPGLVMSKTGTTDLAGGNLAIVFDVGPSHPIAIVVLGSSPEGRFTDMKALISATQTALGSTLQ